MKPVDTAGGEPTTWEIDDPGPAPQPGWRFWVAVAVFWAFFGFVVGNHLFFSMRSHGHSWLRIIVWQMGGAAAWILLTPAVLALDRRFPFASARRWRLLIVHIAAALLFGALHLIPLTTLSRVLDPFRPVPREATFAGEYVNLLGEWMLLDILVYAGILLLAHALELREQHYRDSLRASRLRAELSAAELRALELEIHPHFLFNALNAVAVLVREGDRGRASRMVVGLADLLRLTLKRRGQLFLPLTAELEHVRLYLDVQKTRFEDRLDWWFEVDPAARSATVPALVLQPLVENALRHGIERSRTGGTVSVGVVRDGPRLSLTVCDDGPGPAEDAETAGSGIGLANLRARLRALYEDRWSLELDGRPGGGTRVRVTIPWREPSE